MSMYPIALIIKDYKQIRTARIEFKDGKPLFVAGDNGAGKSSVMELLKMLEDGTRASHSGDYVRNGAEKFKAELQVKGDPIPELVEKYGMGGNLSLIIRKTKLVTSQLQFELVDNDSGKSVNKNRAEIIEAFRGKIADPGTLIDGIRAANGDKEITAAIVQAHGINLNLFDEKRSSFAEEFTFANKDFSEAKLALDKAVENLPNHIPKEKWPATEIDIEVLREEKEKHTKFLNFSQEKERGLADIKTKIALAEQAKTTALENKTQAEKSFNVISGEIIAQLETEGRQLLSLNELKANMKSKDFESEKSILKNKLKEIQDKLDKIEFEESESSRKISESKFRFEQEELNSKRMQDQKQDRKVVLTTASKGLLEKENALTFVKNELERISEEKEVPKWAGLSDPENVLETADYINKMITDGIASNELHNSIVAHSESVSSEKNASENLERVKLAQKELEHEFKQHLKEAKLPEYFTLDSKSRLLAENSNGEYVVLAGLSESERIKTVIRYLAKYTDPVLRMIRIDRGYAFKSEPLQDLTKFCIECNLVPIIEVLHSPDPDNTVYLKDGTAQEIDPVELEIDDKLLTSDQSQEYSDGLDF